LARAESYIGDLKDLSEDLIATSDLDAKSLDAMTVKSIKGSDLQTVKEEIAKKLKERGYDADVFITGGHVEIRGVRLSEKYLDEYGYNVSPYTGRRGNVLGWDNWVDVNDTVNSVLDRMNVSANVQSLGGKFKIRKGRTAMTEDDWQDLAYENVGSIMQPVYRKDAWQSEGIPRKRLKKRGYGYTVPKDVKEEIRKSGGYGTTIKPRPPYYLFVPAINEVPANVRAGHKGEAFALGDFFKNKEEALKSIKKKGYKDSDVNLLKMQGYYKERV
jgi:hypothetical protein